jgi:hypothetical protein
VLLAMYGVIYLWRVKPHKLPEHDAVMKRVLRIERERCPEVLLNLTYGPAADGTCAEIQVYPDEATSRAFPERVKREDPELQGLWAQFDDLTDPEGATSFRFEGMDFLDQSFVRRAAGLSSPRG